MTEATMDFQRFDKQNIFSEFHDEERRALMRDLVQKFPDIRRIPRSVFFFLWFSNIEELRRFLNLESTYLLIALTEPKVDMAGIWAGGKILPKETGVLTSPPRSSRIPGPRHSRSESPQKRLPQSRSRTSPECEIPPRERRSTQARLSVKLPKKSKKNTTKLFQALCRDEYQCVLTQQGMPMVEVSHIMPYKMQGSSRATDWARLRFFWGEEQVKNWQRDIMGDNHRMSTEQVYNMISFSSTIHDAWNRCLCAFRPVQMNEEKTRMDIAFHWLPLRDDKLRQSDQVLCLKNPYSANYLPKLTPGNNNYVFDMGTQRAIPSGYIFTIKTDDPNERPLPSFALLQIQWNLHRIAAMQGAGEDEDSDFDSDGDSIVVPSGSRSPAKDLRGENIAPSRSSTRSVSPTKLRDLSVLYEDPGQLFER
ncbi:hypothetical protein N7520_000726 [Penicillium odoratum]|uniref:uncharacterized protein n=1 Tax=Penicillium odoratum TaxID=1167516 RepID=UPI00254716A6|nr:uncharacterized protein N7520_000726 [Penicillium odoratum]KAJ5777480.1 hypothetical protein N7520_000726 [Penicillium odoratum]